MTPLDHDGHVLELEEQPGSFGMIFATNNGPDCLAPLTVTVTGPARPMILDESYIAAGERKLVARIDAPGATVSLAVAGVEVLAATYLEGPARARRTGRGFRARRYGSPW